MYIIELLKHIITITFMHRVILYKYATRNSGIRSLSAPRLAEGTKCEYRPRLAEAYIRNFITRLAEF